MAEPVIKTVLTVQKPFRNENKKTKWLIINYLAILNGWDTRIRTRNDRTRICSVTITPYPNVLWKNSLEVVSV